MPLLAYLLYRNEAVADADFVEHYRAVHSPLSVEAMPLQTFYAANVARPGAASTAPWGSRRPPVDALAFVGFEDVDVLADPDRLYASVELGERLNADGTYLFSGMDGYVVDTELAWGSPRTWPTGQASPGLQHITLACRRSGVSAATFRDRLRSLAAATSCAVSSDALGGALHVVTGTVSPDAPALDAILEQRWTTSADGAAALASVEAALAELCDADATRTVVADQTIWID